MFDHKNAEYSLQRKQAFTKTKGKDIKLKHAAYFNKQNNRLAEANMMKMMVSI